MVRVEHNKPENRSENTNDSPNSDEMLTRLPLSGELSNSDEMLSILQTVYTNKGHRAE